MRENMLVEAADRSGRRLCRDAVGSGNACNWLGWALEVVGPTWTPVYKAQNSSIYDGTAGIALFLARLYQFTRDAQQRTAALGALNRSFAALPEVGDPLRHSVYSGAAGIAYAAIEIGEALGDERIVSSGLRELRNPRTVQPNETYLDVIGGCAGAIQMLVDIGRRYRANDLLEGAAAHGKVLLKKAGKSDAGWSWDTLPGSGEKHLLGYGPGGGGLVGALI